MEAVGEEVGGGGTGGVEGFEDEVAPADEVVIADDDPGDGGEEY